MRSTYQLEGNQLKVKPANKPEETFMLYVSGNLHFTYVKGLRVQAGSRQQLVDRVALAMT